MGPILLRFLVYGLLGWAAEIVWTAGGRLLFDPSAREGRWRLEGRTYIWMFPIYGSIVFLYEPVHDLLRGSPWPLRATAYAAAFLTVEYLSGWILRRATGACPWDYAQRPHPSRFQVNGLIRLDYAPAWALAGMLLEPLHDFLLRVAPLALGTP
jgi:uncharacterized membrane protein